MSDAINDYLCMDNVNVRFKTDYVKQRKFYTENNGVKRSRTKQANNQLNVNGLHSNEIFKTSMYIYGPLPF